MLTDKILTICNEQIKKEGYSSNLYLAMATWAEANGYAGVAQWLYAQAEEERMHMMKFIEYIGERGCHAIVPEMEAPPVDYGSVKEMFDKILGHEQYISKSINDIIAMCIEEKDYTTHSWIQWFVNEQIEEEASVQAIIDKLNLVGEHNMYIFDRDIIGMRGQEGDSAE
ncbi:ferritin [Bacteroidota bacterium]